jgi:hypothetical protein
MKMAFRFLMNGSERIPMSGISGQTDDFGSLFRAQSTETF